MFRKDLQKLIDDTKAFIAGCSKHVKIAKRVQADGAGGLWYTIPDAGKESEVWDLESYLTNLWEDICRDVQMVQEEDPWSGWKFDNADLFIDWQGTEWREASLYWWRSAAEQLNEIAWNIWDEVYYDE